MTSEQPVASTPFTAAECYRLLEHHTVGRICITDQDGPLTLPVSYRILGPITVPYVVLRTAPTTTLGKYSGLAALEVDEINEDERRAVSVLARGVLRPIDGPHELPDPQPWVTDRRDQWMVLNIRSLSGRHFVVSNNPDGFAVEWQFG